MNTHSLSPLLPFSPSSFQKPFLFFGEGEERFSEELEELKSEWIPILVRSVEEVRKIARRDGVRLGLIALGKTIRLERLQSLQSISDKTIRWIALLDSRHLENSSVMQFIEEFCFDFHRFPLDMLRLKTIMGHAYGMSRLVQSSALPGETQGEHSSEFEMVGSSPMMMECFRSIRKIAGVEAAVLITGESGTGKELVAKAIHERSKRSSGPFVTLNCGAIPHNLIQSELFGYEKGAFTGANARKIGHIESANNGTIMLDEIGDMPLELQVNLLRVLQIGKIQRIGSPTEIPVNVRIIAATHVDLEKACREGRFREDLFYRLHVLKINLPSLRERGEDIALLAQYFFKRFAKDYGSRLKGLSPESMEEIYAYAWPGNVRELINKIKSAVLMSDGPYIQPADLQLSGGIRNASRRIGKTLKEIKEAVERETLVTSLQKFQNNISRASRELGVTRTTFYILMKKYGLTV
ncbi:MAG: sigma-54 dependent transcriptional regulator [Leptospirales bacterium]